MAGHFFEIGYTQHSGKHSQTQHDALWDGEHCVQKKNVNAGERFRDGAEAVLLAVADGVSASNMPHLASSFVVKALGALNPGLGITAKIVRDIHGQLCDRYGRGSTKDTATTVVAACLQDEICQVINVGDSRAYLITGSGQWTQLSHDHTYLNELKEDGYLEDVDDEGALYDQLMDCLIANHEEDGFPIHSIQTSFRPGDSLLLCSDGLHDVLQEDTLKQLYNRALPPADQVGIWLRAVLDAGAPDNVSIILARLNR